MADSIDRVFVHALNTVKKIPRTGAMRPPPENRLRLYGLYKQAMEGDVDGVMERPVSVGCGLDESEDVKKDRDKYDSWYAQRGLSRTEAKRKYVETLIDTMHRYANTTADARALVDELEFVWDQIKNNAISSNGSSPSRATKSMGGAGYGISTNLDLSLHKGEGPMRVLSPRSQDGEIEISKGRKSMYSNERDESIFEGVLGGKATDLIKWQKTVEQTLVKLTAEVAALREQIVTSRGYQGKKKRSPGKCISWLWWMAVKHFFVDMVVLGLLLLLLRRKKDRRLENLFRQGLGVGREYMRQILL